MNPLIRLRFYYHLSEPLWVAPRHVMQLVQAKPARPDIRGGFGDLIFFVIFC
mgnify:CR=1 FL=1